MEDSDAVLFDLVRGQLAALALPGLTVAAIRPRSLLIDDLGLDSLKFVDLTVGLEEALGIEEFPMQDWVDQQLEKQRPLDVAALMQACREALSGSQAAQ